MSTLSVNSIKDVQSFDFSNTPFLGAFTTANSGYVVANSGYNTANVSYTFGNTVYAAVNSSFAVTNAAFGRANTALQNTSGVTFAGDYYVTGNVGIGTTTTTAGTLTVSGNYGAASGTFSGGQPGIRVTGSTSAFSEPRIDLGEQTLSPTGYFASKNEGNGGGSLIFGNRDTSSTSSALTERMRIKSTGQLYMTSGQIQFPATQVASSDANTLDDYEEGTWTVVFGGATSESGQSYDVRNGNYIKIGRFVYARFDARFTAKGTITGSLQIKGLPFTTGGEVYACYLSHYSGLNSNVFKLSLTLGSSVTAADLYQTTATSTTDANGTDTNLLTNTTRLIGTIIYQTA
jgi:hypothetical protein